MLKITKQGFFWWRVIIQYYYILIDMQKRKEDKKTPQLGSSIGFLECMYVYTSSSRHLEACPYFESRPFFFSFFFFQQSRTGFQTKLTHPYLRGTILSSTFQKKKNGQLYFVSFPPSLRCAWTAFAKTLASLKRKIHTNNPQPPYTHRQSEMCMIMNDDNHDDDLFLVPSQLFLDHHCSDIITRLLHFTHTHIHTNFIFSSNPYF